MSEVLVMSATKRNLVMITKSFVVFLFGVVVLNSEFSVSIAGAQEFDSRCSLYTVSSEGEDAKYIGSAPEYSGAGSPVYSPDGTMIAFDAFPPPFDYRKARVFIYAVAGPYRGTFRDLGYGNVPSWAPDGGQIAFMLNHGTPDGEPAGVYIMESDGSNRHHIAEGWAPHWSPDGKKIAFQSPRGGIHAYDVETEHIKEIFGGNRFQGIFAGAAWSPDSQHLAFICRWYDGKRSVVIVDASEQSGEERKLWSENNDIGYPRARPSWSPDGKRLVFQLRKGESPSHYARVFDNYLYTISVEDPGQPSLLENQEVGTMNTSPSYSPCGERIVFSSQR